MTAYSEIQFYGLVLCAIVLSVLFSSVIAVVFIRRLKRQQYEAYDRLDVRMNIMRSGAHGMGQKLLQLEEKLQALQVSQEEIKTSNSDFSFTTAQKLMEEGIDDRSIAANSGLSATEINLMRLLHRQELEPRSNV